MGVPIPQDQSASSTPGPIGHRGTRAAVLLHLKRDGAAAAAAIAAALDCSLNTVRHHLKELEASALVTHDRIAHGVGAPAHIYRLSGKGHDLFPDRYAGTVSGRFRVDGAGTTAATSSFATRATSVLPS